MNNRPKDWDEHKALCRWQLGIEIARLYERAESLQQFLDGFDAAVDDGPTAITELAMNTNVADTEDYLVRAIEEIYQQGDSIMTAPGEGYW